ncbi:hypothetical protein UlMin_046006 [Ulmus minor]
MTDLGSASKILGMTIERDKHRKTLKITQKTYLEKLVDKFGMKDAKPTRIPLAGHFKLLVNLELVKEEERRKKKEERRYMERILYKEHWEAMKRLIRYIKGSTNLGLIYKNDGNRIWLDGYIDSYYAGDIDRRRYTTSYFFTINGCCVSWKSQLQSIVALSTTEAEYIAST